MRVNGIIDYDSIVDEKRKFKQYYKSGNVETFIENEVASFLDDYDRDLLQSQERFVAIVCEKETLSYQIDRANREYALPVLYTQGNSSITVRHSLIREARDRPITLLMLTDLDPSGMKIQDSFVGSLEKDFENKDLRAYRVALKTEHIEEYNLFSDQTAKISDTSFKKFHKVTGLKNAYELDAMDPDDMVELLEKSIRAVLDMDRFNEQLRIYQDDVADLSIKRQKALGSMII
jgi:5S rRNA maturation endonuclease (ribonuclease M5)